MKKEFRIRTALKQIAGYSMSLNCEQKVRKIKKMYLKVARGFFFASIPIRLSSTFEVFLFRPVRFPISNEPVSWYLFTLVGFMKLFYSFPISISQNKIKKTFSQILKMQTEHSWTNKNLQLLSFLLSHKKYMKRDARVPIK